MSKDLTIKQDTNLALNKSRSTLSITSKILSGKTSLTSEVIEDWIKEIWAWADENKIEEVIQYILEYEDLHLEYGGNMYFFHCVQKDLKTLRSKEEKYLVEIKDFYEMQNEHIDTLLGNYDASAFSSIYYLQTGISRHKNILINSTALDLSEKNLSSIPQEIFLLSKLEALGLASNNLTVLPQEISNLSQLTTLDLGNNQLETLPEEICELVNLKNLLLYNSKLILTSSQKDWIIHLQNNGCYIELDDTEDWIKEIWVWADRNDIDSNIIPRSKDLYSLLPLKTIDLSGLGLDSISSRLCFLEYVTTLNLADNNIKELPKEILNFRNLKVLNLKNNPLVLTQSQQIWIRQIKEKGCEVHLDSDVIEYSQNKDLIDDSWMERLWRWADANRIKEPSGEWFDQNSDYSITWEQNDGIWRNQPLLLSSTKLAISSGHNIRELPEEISDLIHLKEFYISGGGCTVDIYIEELPKSFFQLKNLKKLILNQIGLNTVPKDIGNLKNLTTFVLSANKLRELPIELGKLTNLKYLDFGEVPSLNGPYNGNKGMEIGNEICDLVKLEYLNLSGLALKKLPHDIVKLENLKVLILTNNDNLLFTENQQLWLDNLKNNGCEISIKKRSNI